MSDMNASKDRSLEAMQRAGAAGSPVVIDLGKQPKKRVKDLRNGKPGKLLREVSEAIDALRAQDAIAKDAQPIIVVVRERRRRGNLFGL